MICLDERGFQSAWGGRVIYKRGPRWPVPIEKATTLHKVGVWIPTEEGEVPDWRRAQPIEEKLWADWRAR